MNNDIFNAISGNAPNPFGNMENFLTQFNQFKQAFKGNPEQAINSMLQNGQISQTQLNQAKHMAEQIQQLMR